MQSEKKKKNRKKKSKRGEKKKHTQIKQKLRHYRKAKIPAGVPPHLVLQPRKINYHPTWRKCESLNIVNFPNASQLQKHLC